LDVDLDPLDVDVDPNLDAFDGDVDV